MRSFNSTIVKNSRDRSRSSSSNNSVALVFSNSNSSSSSFDSISSRYMLSFRQFNISLMIPQKFHLDKGKPFQKIDDTPVLAICMQLVCFDLIQLSHQCFLRRSCFDLVKQSSRYSL